MLQWLQRLFRPGENAPLGPRGEEVAARYLRKRGLKIILRNYRAPVGEIDIIARDGEVIVFTEVKTREEDDPRPEDQVDRAKQHQLTKAAKVYLNKYGHPHPPARFDVVAVVWPPGGEPVIRHTKSAFEATF
jgi:putative endonuclease